MKNFFLIFFTAFLCTTLLRVCYGQGLKGRVLNEKQEPIPFANIFLPLLQTGTASNAWGEYLLTLPPGNYEVVISSVGYLGKRVEVVVTDQVTKQDFVLESADTELSEITVKASRRDPAYEIIQLVIENRSKYRRQIGSFRSQVYVKASEEIETLPKNKNKPDPVPNETGLAAPVEDPFEAEKKERQQLLASLNLVEMQLTLNYQAPNTYKEERTAYKAYGSKEGLFIPIFGENDFNFYDNLVLLKGIADAPVISPISRTAILSYKFKLESSQKEGGLLVHKIKVTPRNEGSATVSGYLFINDSLWNINRLDLSLTKGAAKIYDQFRLQLNYEQLNDTLWLPTRQEMIYETSQGQRKHFRGSTLVAWRDFEAEYEFPSKFFGNELAVTTREAYKRDSLYWQTARTEPLREKEQKMVQLRDSIERVRQSKVYRDSIEKAYNKITFTELMLTGVGFRKDSTQRHIYFGSLSNLIGFEVVGGFRLGPYLSYFKRWESGRLLSVSSNGNIGLKNADVQGSGSVFVRYAPFKLADFRIAGGRSFQSINPFDAYLTQLRVSNYILNDYLSFWHQFELFNGFYLATSVQYRNRQSVDRYNSRTFINDVIDATNAAALAFENYQAFITDWKILYTPKQRFLTEPDRKVVLGSSFPTFGLLHRRGWDGPLSSDIRFDYWEASIEQNLIVGAMGNSKYWAAVGKFTNADDLRFVDLKRFRQSDPILFSDPRHTFQLLDTALSATSYFFEAHHIHHFNGTLLNNLPLIKKTKIGFVAGVGLLWIRENGYRHEEVFGGVERIFKLGARRRLRLGVYGILAESNRTGFAQGVKVSFDVIDTWKRDWSY